MGLKLYKEVKIDGVVIGLTEKGYHQYLRTGTYSESEFIGYKKINALRRADEYSK